MLWRLKLLLPALLLVVAATGCGVTPAPTEGDDEGPPAVLAMESYLADIVGNVAGERATVSALIPTGVDPHAFEPSPSDVARASDADIIVFSGAGLEGFAEQLLDNARPEQVVIDASEGLVSRTVPESEAELLEEEDDDHALEGDPHFWLDPISVIHYVERVRDGLSEADPEGEAVYAANAAAYIEELRQLDVWIREQVEQVPSERRLLVTNHESFGYYADRYGFTVIGTVVPGVTSGATPSARELAQLVDRIRETGAPAIFLETGANPRLAEQVARETGVQVVSGLYTHSPSEPDGPAPTYIEMMKYNTTAIVEALRPAP